MLMTNRRKGTSSSTSTYLLADTVWLRGVAWPYTSNAGELPTYLGQEAARRSTGSWRRVCRSTHPCSNEWPGDVPESQSKMILHSP